MFNALRQIPNTIRQGVRNWLGIPAGYTAWDGALFSPEQWDALDERLRRYQIYHGYKENIIYYNAVEMSRIFQQRPKPYKRTRGIYNPIDRLVELYVAEVYGGMLDMEQAATGAIQVDCPDELRLPITRLWEWSNWQQNKSLFVYYGALFGDSAIKVVDSPKHEMVWMEILDPRKIVDYEKDSAGELTMIEIAYDRYDKVAKRAYTYSELITLDSFRTFRDGEPFAFYQDVLGVPIDTWDNEYGFIPVALAQHRVSGMKWGRTSFANLLDKINEINDQASLLNDGVRKTTDPLFAAIGAKANEIILDNSRDSVPVLSLPPNTDLKPLTPTIDVANISQHVQTLLMELERDMPELSLHRLREGGNLTAPGVKAAFSDAISRIDEARGNYNSALIKAQSMAVAIGGLRGYDGFQGWSVDQMWDGSLRHSIKERSIVEDTLTANERILALQTVNSTRLILRELGYSEDDIAEELGREDEQARAAIRGMTEAAFGQQSEDEEGDDTDTEAEEGEGIA